MAEVTEYTERQWRQTSQEVLASVVVEEVNALRRDKRPESAITRTLENAEEMAERIIEAAGYDLGDSDLRGSEMSDTVQAALIFALLRIGPEGVEELTRII